MSIPGDQVLEQALSLPADERVRVAAELMRSVQTPPEMEIDAAWAEEADRRLERFRSGQTGAISAHLAIDQVSEWLRSRHG